VYVFLFRREECLLEKVMQCFAEGEVFDLTKS